METATRLLRFSQQKIGERIIGCFGPEKEIESYVFGLFLGSDDDDEHVMVFMHESEVAITKTTNEDMCDAVAIYQVLIRDIKKGTQILNEKTGKDFCERWECMNKDRFERSKNRRENIRRFEACATLKDSSPSF